MTEPSAETIRERLRSIAAPGSEGDIVSNGLVSDIFITKGKVFFSLTVPAALAEKLEPLRKAAEELVQEMPGVQKATVALTAERKAGPGNASQPAANAPTVKPAGKPAPSGRHTIAVPGIKAIVAIASGKGGVGKSTTAVNLALALEQSGLSVGILDADVYGPSIPRLLGLSGKPEMAGEKMIEPMQNYGIKAMSMGFMVEEDTPMVWRGPMVTQALTQMLRGVAWGELDVLIVDMPPGTGDVQLSLAQQVPMAGAVIVSTPQDLALLDARKGLNMFRKVDVPVLGIVENMSLFVCPDCGASHSIFGHGGAKAEAEKLDVPFLGEVPLQMAIRETSDAGRPVLVSDRDGKEANIYRQVAGRLMEEIETATETQDEGPAIIFE
ncbi:Mrp/NBP35 family ATP-binding protein [Notoacmeibacter sp. MSK16QG-6]|uniref:Mrp/NBP35 family ATP-binding protein n=1 Tax=Notoacmeibacter sp. MSK16QG-6 TaxID=2957982 RepID=UPI00209FEAE6|nr:Mrp/NBP35 family ATP-binding protein [Notoacmeibacter sp. MSK16QG-6]MCP1198681.1 Mrp/NBP35 family ATP-binding protein [Notoacmeibacter sp. MSK16QG-6]